MATHANRVCIQTLHSAELRDAEKLRLYLNGFVGRIPDPDGIIQQVSLTFMLDTVKSLPFRAFFRPRWTRLMFWPSVHVDTTETACCCGCASCLNFRNLPCHTLKPKYCMHLDAHSCASQHIWSQPIRRDKQIQPCGAHCSARACCRCGATCHNGVQPLISAIMQVRGQCLGLLV